MFSSTPCFAWGSVAHTLIAELASNATSDSIFKNCHITKKNFINEINDPDSKWRDQHYTHFKEASAHYIHLDLQPADWEDRSKAFDTTQGFLYYRILSWWAESRELKKANQWARLHEHLIGLGHYLGDLTQPLHLTSDHDGKNHGLMGLHSQYESKMIRRYLKEIKPALVLETKKTAPSKLWQKMELKTILSSTARQSFLRSAELFKLAESSKIIGKNKRLSFNKKILWNNTRLLTLEQLSVAIHLIEFALNDICK